MALRRIEPRFVPRIWGSLDLRPWFGERAEKTGEVWFETRELLIKFLFTSQPLSVQVHPDDEYARRHENQPGKTEMWHILRASPGARLALGFLDTVSADTARRAALDGTIERLLAWHEPRAGDTYFTPARTVHALGAGLVVAEIQPPSDVTYRLYDYGRLDDEGRPRPLHLDKGFDVANLVPCQGRRDPVPTGEGGELLAACSYFVTERWSIDRPWTWPADSVMIVVEGHGTAAGHGFSPGDVWHVEGGEAIVPLSRAVLLRTYVPES